LSEICSDEKEVHQKIEMDDEKIISQDLESHVYIIQCKISSESYGIVYKVHSLKCNSSFSAKFVKKHFDEEIECLCRLIHLNIVAPYQSFE
jgi:serine/threonine protein kinase